MVTPITYPASNRIIEIRGYSNALSPIPTTETEILNTLNMGEDIADAIRSNSQAALNFVVNLGSLSSVKFRIYYFYKHAFARDGSGNFIPYVQTTSVFSSGSEILNIDEIVVSDASLNNVGLSYMFPLRGCDGIRITIKGEGASNTGSSLRNAFVSLRVN